jgi:hypothetical protein
VVVKNVDRFQTPAIVKAYLANLRKPILLVAPYITRETAERCRYRHLPLIDTTGNVYLEALGRFEWETVRANGFSDETILAVECP